MEEEEGRERGEKEKEEEEEEEEEILTLPSLSWRAGQPPSRTS